MDLLSERKHLELRTDGTGHVNVIGIYRVIIKDMRAIRAINEVVMLWLYVCLYMFTLYYPGLTEVKVDSLEQALSLAQRSLSLSLSLSG